MNDILEKSHDIIKLKNREESGDWTSSHINYGNGLHLDLLLFHPESLALIFELAGTEDPIDREKEYDMLEKESRRQKIIEKISECQNSFLLSNKEFLYNKLSDIQFEDILLEESFESMIIKLKFRQNIFLILNIPINNNTINTDFVVFTIIENGNLIVSNIKTIDEIISGIKSYLNDTEIPNLSHS